MSSASLSGPAPAEKMVPTSLKLPASVKAQIDANANLAGMTAHAYMVRALAKTVERARLRAQFDADTAQAWEAVQRDNAVYDFDEARAHFAARADARERGAPEPDTPRPKPWRETPGL